MAMVRDFFTLFFMIALTFFALTFFINVQEVAKQTLAFPADTYFDAARQAASFLKF